MYIYDLPVSFFVQSLNPQLNVFCFLFLFLLICGDVHPNPGPSSDGSSISSHTSDLIHNCLTVMHLNIRSVRTKLIFLESFADDVDILCLTETHLDESVTDDQLMIENFSELHRKDRNMFGGGIMIYVKQNVNIAR